MVEDVPLTDYAVHQVSVSIELVLDNIVEDLEKEEDKVVISMICKQEPRCRERLKKVHKFTRRNHTHLFQVGRNVHYDGKDTVEERLQSVVAACYYLVENQNKKVSMVSSENGEVHWNSG